MEKLIAELHSPTKVKLWHWNLDINNTLFIAINEESEGEDSNETEDEVEINPYLADLGDL